jgi:hypothetical protein
VQLHADYLYVANTPESFAAEVDRALSENSPFERQRRQQHAAAYDWDSHVRNKLDALTGAFGLAAVHGKASGGYL